jgi:outer membrane murein-binding lipoprotein Lpp
MKATLLLYVAFVGASVMLWSGCFSHRSSAGVATSPRTTAPIVAEADRGAEATRQDRGAIMDPATVNGRVRAPAARYTCCGSPPCGACSGLTPHRHTETRTTVG